MPQILPIVIPIYKRCLKVLKVVQKKNLTINPSVIDSTYKTPSVNNFGYSTATNKEN